MPRPPGPPLDGARPGSETVLKSLHLPRPRYYGWTIVAIGVLVSALSSPGQSFILSLYVDALIADLGLSRVTIASLYGACTLAAALALPLVGRAADATTSRRFMGGTLALFAGAIALFSQAQGVVTLALAFFCLRLLGQGAIGLATLTATARWFERRRPRALATAALGYALGELTFPGVTLWLTTALGWRGALLALAAVYLVVFTPLVLRFTRERDPAREPLDGDAPPADGEHVGSPRSPALAFTLSAALRERAFWLTLLSVAVMPLVLTGLIFQQVALFGSLGWDVALIPTAFVATALAGVAAGFGTGLLLERVDVQWGLVGAALAGLATLGVAMLGLAPLPSAIMYGALLGVANGMASTTNSVIWPAYFGVAALGSIKGVVNGVRNGATAIGAPLVALLLAAGDPRAPFWTLGALFVVMAGVALRLRPPVAPRAEADASIDPPASLAA